MACLFVTDRDTSIFPKLMHAITLNVKFTVLQSEWIWGKDKAIQIRSILHIYLPCPSFIPSLSDTSLKVLSSNTDRGSPLTWVLVWGALPCRAPLTTSVFVVSSTVSPFFLLLLLLLLCCNGRCDNTVVPLGLKKKSSKPQRQSWQQEINCNEQDK